MLFGSPLIEISAGYHGILRIYIKNHKILESHLNRRGFYGILIHVHRIQET